MKPTINLASRRYLNQRLVSLMFMVMVVLSTLVLFRLVSTSLQNHQRQQDYRQEIATLEEQLQGVLPQRLSAADLARQQERYQQAVKLWQRDSFRWTELLEQLESLVPEGVQLLSLQPDYQKNSVKLNGEARGLEALQELLDQLHQETFTHVFLYSKQTIEVDDGRGGKRAAIGFSLGLEGVF